MLSLLLTFSVFAQHTLTLKVGSLTDPGKDSLITGAKIYSTSSDTVAFSDSNFNIAIKASSLKFIVKFETVTQLSRPIVYHITSDSILAIKATKIIGTSFNFMPTMTITIQQDGNGDQTIKKYINLHFRSPSTNPSTGPTKKRSTYYDALYLKNEQNDDTILQILRYYTNLDSSATTTQLDSILKLNPFLASYWGILSKKAIPQSSFSLSSISSSVGGLDVTTIANGIADLMIDRAKQELTVAFFNHFKTFAANNPEFSTLFPKTTANLNNLLTYTYPQMLPALRTGFLQDIQQIPDHLDAVLALPRYVTLLKNYPEVRVAIRSIHLISELKTGASNAADVFNEFAGFEEWTDTAASKDLKNAGFCIKVANLLSESIRNDSSQSHTNTVWVPGKDLKNLFYDSVLFKIYLGLLYEHSKNITYINSTGQNVAFSSILAKQQNNLFVFQTKLKGFFDLADEVDATLTAINDKKKTNTPPTNDDYFNYISVAIDVVDYGFDVVKVFDNITVSDDYISLARKSNDLYKDIYTKEYTQAIQDGLGIFTLVDSVLLKKFNLKSLKTDSAVTNYSGAAKNSVSSLKKGNSVINAVKPNEIDQVVQLTTADTTIALSVKDLAQYRLLQNLLTFIDKLKPYALFMANIVQAKDENAVKAALDNVILPVGSSSIKKNTRCNISVQSYLGAFYASGNNPSSTIGTWSDKFGVIAPIGISWTPSWLSWRSRGCISVFGSLLDLGAIVDYKLSRDSTFNTADNATTVSKNYSVKLGQLFSPGVYLVYGFAGNIPLSVGFGSQYGPGLSKINTTTNATTVNNPYWRWNVFLAVDLPFFNLVNKNKSAK